MIWGICDLKFNCSIYVFSMLTLQTIADHLCLFWTLSWPTFYQNVYWNIDWSQSGIHLNLCFQDFLWFALHVEHSYLWIFFLLKNLLKIFFMLGGNSVVSCTWGSLGRPAVCMSNWHLECRMYICRDGYKETIVSWWFRNWSTFPYFQVCMQFPEIHYFKFPSLYLHDTLLQNWLLHSKASQNQNRSKTLRKVSTVDKTGFHHAYFIVTVWLYGYTTCIFMYHIL